MNVVHFTYFLTVFHVSFRSSFVKAEVAWDGKGLLLDVGLLFDLRRTLRLALDPLGTRRIRACGFALRALVFQLAVRAAVAVSAVLFQLAMRAGDAHHAVLFQLAVRAGGARRAPLFQLAVQTGVARWTAAFPLAVRAGSALRAAGFHLAVRAAVAHHAFAFQLSVGAAVAVRAVVFQLAVRTGGARSAVLFQLAVRAAFALRAASFHLTMGGKVAHHAATFLPPVRASLYSHRSCPTNTARHDLRCGVRESGVVAFPTSRKRQTKSFRADFRRIRVIVFHQIARVSDSSPSQHTSQCLHLA